MNITIVHLNLIDNLVLFACVIGVFAIGYYFSKTASSMESFYQANRSLPWSLVVGSVMASWYGGAGVIGTIGYTTSMGIAAFFIWSIGIHLVRFPLALWVAPRISVKVNTTMPELLNRFYGRVASLLGAVVLVISCSSIAEIAATGYVGEAAWGIDKLIVAGIVVIIAISITCLGGLMGVAVTDMIFFFLMITCVVTVFPQVFFDIGGFDGIESSLSVIAPEMLTTFGGIPLGRAIMLIVMGINMYKDPAFYQRFTAANTPKTGKRAMLLCFSLWLSFDCVLIFTGISIRTLDPEFALQPEVAYVALILSYLPVVARGLFVFGLMGAIISTIDSYFLIGGEIMANDIIAPLRKKSLSDKESIMITRICCIIFGLVGLFTAFQFPMVYDAFLFVTSLSMAVLFVPVLSAILYSGKKTDTAGITSMIVGAVSWVYFNLNPMYVPFLSGDIDAILVALPLSFLGFLVGNQFGTERCKELL